jgi:hypothetical protein
MPWNDWIASQECLPTIRYIRSLFSDKEESIINEAFRLVAVKQTQQDLSADDEITNELWLFFKLHFSDKIKNEFSTAILTGNVSAMVNILKFAFVNHCKGMRRKSNPYNKCYTSIREKLHKTSKKDQSLQYRADRNAAFYAFCDTKPREASEGIWNQYNIHNYRNWEAPSCGFSLDDPAKNAVDIARSFWMESLRFHGDKYWIPIRELTNFIFAKFVDIAKNPTVSLYDENDIPVDIPDKQHPLPEAMWSQIRRELEAEAKKLVSSWDENRKVIFYLAFEKDLTLRQIEEQGYKSAQYNIDNARKSIRIQWNNWKSDEKDIEDMFEDFCSDVMRFVNMDAVVVYKNIVPGSLS